MKLLNLPRLCGAGASQAEPIREAMVSEALEAGVNVIELRRKLDEVLFHAGPWNDGTGERVIRRMIAETQKGTPAR